MGELPIDNETFRRCQMLFAFKDLDGQNSNNTANSSLVTGYSPSVRGQFNIGWTLPENYMNIHAYEECMQTSLSVPYYNQPEPGSELPSRLSKRRIPQPEYSSLLPLLLAAHRNDIYIGQYQVVSERHCLREIAMNNEDYVVGVQKFGQTLFLRRYDCRRVNMNDHGYRFEEMCTPHYRLKADYYQLIEGCFGNIRTLITAETDAVDRQNGQAIELKCRVNENLSTQDRSQYWLQAFFGGIPTIKIGHRIDEIIESVDDVTVANMISDDEKNKIINRLHQTLQFLRDQVFENEVYLFARRTDQGIGIRQLYLYRVGRQDKQGLTFITQAMLDQLFPSGEGSTHRTSVRRRKRRVRDEAIDPSDDDDAEQYEDDTISTSRLDKMNRLEEKKKENVFSRRANDQ